MIVSMDAISRMDSRNSFSTFSVRAMVVPGASSTSHMKNPLSSSGMKPGSTVFESTHIPPPQSAVRRNAMPPCRTRSRTTRR